MANGTERGQGSRNEGFIGRIKGLTSLYPQYLTYARNRLNEHPRRRITISKRHHWPNTEGQQQSIRPPRREQVAAWELRYKDVSRYLAATDLSAQDTIDKPARAIQRAIDQTTKDIFGEVLEAVGRKETVERIDRQVNEERDN